MGKEGGGFLTPKAIANRIKAKGLQKLRWYCQMCEKQCRDENGFKCHCMSESHQRQMSLFRENSGKYMETFSKDFEKSFMDILRRKQGTRVKANSVYQEIVADRGHVHMNSTIWSTLTNFIQYLGKTGKAIVDQTPKGWYIRYVKQDADVIARQEAIIKREKHELDEAERQNKAIEKQIELARKAEEELGIKREEKTDDAAGGAGGASMELDREKMGTLSIKLKDRTEAKKEKLAGSALANPLLLGADDDEDGDGGDGGEEGDGSDGQGQGHGGEHKGDSPNGVKQESKREDDVKPAAPLKFSIGGSSSSSSSSSSSRLGSSGHGSSSSSSSSSSRDDSSSSSSRKRRFDSTEKREESASKRHRSALEDIVAQAEEQQRRKQQDKEREEKQRAMAAVAASSSSSNGKEAGGEERLDHWLYPNIIVKILNQELRQGKYYKKKGRVLRVHDDYVAEVELLDSPDRIKLDQSELETVIPALGKPIMIVNGRYRGQVAVLAELDQDKFCVNVKLGDRLIKALPFEDVCKTAD